MLSFLGICIGQRSEGVEIDGADAFGSSQQCLAVLVAENEVLILEVNIVLLAVLALNNGRTKVKAALLTEIELFKSAAAEFADLHYLLQLFHNIGAVCLCSKDGLADLLCLGDAAECQCFLDLSLAHTPGGEADSHIIEHAHLACDLLAGMVAYGIYSDLITVYAAEAHGRGGMTVEAVKGGVQLGNCTAVAVCVNQLDSLVNVLVGKDGNKDGNEGIHTAHFAGVKVLNLLALCERCLLECLECVNSVRSEHRQARVEHCDRRTERCDHCAVIVFADFLNVNKVNGNLVALFLCAVEHVDTELQGAAATCAKQSCAVQDLKNVLLVKSFHYNDLHVFCFFG